MRADLLNRMQCPYCAGTLRLERSYRDEGRSILTGIVRCPCSSFPILEGILVLRPPVDRGYLADLVRQGHADYATHLLLGARDPQWLRFVTAARRGNRLRRIALAPAARYLVARGKRRWDAVRRGRPFVHLLGDSPFETYLKHRFASETLWLAYAAMPLLGARDGVTLELGCGAGHASYVLRSLSEVSELICADHSFRELLLARTYMAPDASFIQLDANLPLPFREDTFDCVFGLDWLHYVDAKKAISEEMKRVLRAKGVLLLLHLHNALQHNPSPGVPLAPQGWIELLQGFSVRAVADRRIIDDLLTADQLDFRQSSSVEELNTAPAMSIVASEEPSVFGRYDRIREQQFAMSKNLRVNTVYRRVKRESDEAVRRFPTASFAAEFPLSSHYLPERIVAGRSLRGDPAALAGPAREDALRLFKKFALVDLPRGYMEEDGA